MRKFRKCKKICGFLGTRSKICGNYAELCGIMRNYAELCGIMRKYAELCGIMRNYAELCGPHKSPPPAWVGGLGVLSHGKGGRGNAANC